MMETKIERTCDICGQNVKKFTFRFEFRSFPTWGEVKGNKYDLCFQCANHIRAFCKERAKILAKKEEQNVNIN